MAHQPTDEIPLMQRLYNKIWLLAALATIFFFVVYLGWAMIDIAAVPSG
ncbi:hypothetical protein [Natrarchaeobius chitinivorans]|nr:hypothetical protein [Natrarchaeobius chitinivorans]